MAVAVDTGGMSVAHMAMAAVGGIVGASLVAWGLVETSHPLDAERDARQLELFVKKYACPVSGKHTDACPGWVVGYVKPLCAGGADRVANMQWQTVATAKKKDRDAQKTCAKAKRG